MKKKRTAWRPDRLLVWKTSFLAAGEQVKGEARLLGAGERHGNGRFPTFGSSWMSLGKSLWRQAATAGCDHPFSCGALPLRGSLKAKAVSFKMETPLSLFKVQLLPWKPDSLPLSFRLGWWKSSYPPPLCVGVSGNVPGEADGDMGVMSAEWLGKDVVGDAIVCCSLFQTQALMYFQEDSWGVQFKGETVWYISQELQKQFQQSTIPSHCLLWNDLLLSLGALKPRHGEVVKEGFQQ